MPEVAIGEIVRDASIYPRSERNGGRVRRYAESMVDGDVFPPIILESDTNRLLDGWHRVAAAELAERDALLADWHTIPEGVDPRLYAASLSAKLGLEIDDRDLRDIARDVYGTNREAKVVEVAAMLGRPRRTVQDWIQDLAEARMADRARQREARRLAAALLSEAGWKQADIAKALGVSQGQVAKIIPSGEPAAGNIDLDESALRLALDLVPDEIQAKVEAIAERWREERIFAAWTDDERERLALLREGVSVVVSYRDDIHANLIKWADQAGLLVRVDRRSDWGNPFLMGQDGDRDTVIDTYRDYYLPHKPSLRRRMTELEGKALACWCAPERCHADVLLDIVEAIE